MKKIEVDELKNLQMEIMQFFHDFCQEKGINYSLSGGTLLGAVRHKGYIPWDDDIDVMMPRPDYDKFCSLFPSEKCDYRLLNCHTDKQFFQPFTKIVNIKTFIQGSYDRPMDNLGVNIDVFPVDGLPDGEDKRKKYWKKIFRLRNLNTIIYQKELNSVHGIKLVIRNILFVLFKILPATYYTKKIDKKAASNDFYKSEFVAVSVFGYGKKEEVSHDVYDSYVDLDFEGRKYKAMAGYDKYLSSLYGDYMQLPPEEKRIAKHDIQVFWR